MAVDDMGDLACVLSLGVVSGSHDEMVATSIGRIPAGRVPLAPLDDTDQPARLARVLGRRVGADGIDRRGRHERVIAAAGNPPKGKPAAAVANRNRQPDTLKEQSSSDGSLVGSSFTSATGPPA